jgi:hypothetical protein
VLTLWTEKLSMQLAQPEAEADIFPATALANDKGWARRRLRLTRLREWRHYRSRLSNATLCSPTTRMSRSLTVDVLYRLSNLWYDQYLVLVVFLLSFFYALIMDW